jgi:hypothetical protein
MHRKYLEFQYLRFSVNRYLIKSISFLIGTSSIRFILCIVLGLINVKARLGVDISDDFFVVNSFCESVVVNDESFDAKRRINNRLIKHLLNFKVISIYRDKKETK